METFNQLNKTKKDKMLYFLKETLFRVSTDYRFYWVIKVQRLGQVIARRLNEYIVIVIFERRIINIILLFLY